MEEEALVTYCGLCCLDCHGYTQKIPDLAKDLRKELRRTHYDTFARTISSLPFGAAFKNYQECYDALGLMMKFRCTKGCRKGGGPPSCRIRNCCQEKGYNGCWECEDYEHCSTLDFLKANHGDGHLKNLAFIRKSGVKGFLKKKRRW